MQTNAILFTQILGGTVRRRAREASDGRWEIGSLYVGLGFDTAVFDRQIVQIPQRAEAAANSIKKSFTAASGDLDKFQRSAGATRAAVQNLSFQLNDIATSLASGGSPFRVLAQQSGQIVQVFQQGGGVRNVLAATATAIRGMITPTTAAIAGVAGLTAGFAALLVGAQNNIEALRQYNLLLAQTGRASQNIDINAENARLRAIGITGSVATAQRMAIGRNSVLNTSPEAVERFQTLGANIGARLGTGAEAGFQSLMQAVQAGPEATIKMALALDALSAKQAAALLSSARLSGGLREQNTALVAMEENLKNFAKNAMDPTTEATNKLAAAWDRLLNSMQNTRTVQGARQGIVDLITAIADAAEGKLTTREISEKIFPYVNPIGVAVGAGVRAMPSMTFGSPAANQADLAAALASRGPGPSGTPSAELAARMAEERSRAVPEGFYGSRVTAGVAAGRAGYGVGGAVDRSGATSAITLGRGDLVLTFDKQKVAEANDAITKLKQTTADEVRILKLNAQQQEIANAALAKQNDFLAAGYPLEQANEAARIAGEAAAAKFNITLERENTLTDKRIENERAVAKAMLQSASAAAQAQATGEARLEVLQRGGDAGRRAGQILGLRGAMAEQNIAGRAEQDRQQREVVELQARLLGQSTEEIEKQVALLRVRQEIEAAGVPVSQEIADARLREATALADTNTLLAQRRETMGQLREVASVIEGAFTRAFDSLADGTFKLRDALGGLLKDLGRMLANQAFRALFEGKAGGGGGLFGTLLGAILPGAKSATTATGIAGWSWNELGIPGAATGGSFRVGGSGSLDSQLVAMRASPGEMVDVTPAGQSSYGGRGELIQINLNPSEGWVAGVADQRITLASGQIVSLSVTQSQRAVARNFSNISREAQARSL